MFLQRYTHLRFQYRRELKILICGIWIFSFVFSLGEVYGHAREFFGENRTRKYATNYHHVRTVVALVLTLVVVVLWTVTFCKTCYVFRSAPTTNISAAAVSKERQEESTFDYENTTTTSDYDNTTTTSFNTTTTSFSTTTTKFSTTTVPSTSSESSKQEDNKAISKKTKRRKPSQSASAIFRTEMKLVRVFAFMLVIFLVCYTPILSYLVNRLIQSGNFAGIDSNTSHVLWATGITALDLVSCLNPILVMLRIDNFRFKMSGSSSFPKLSLSMYR